MTTLVGRELTAIARHKALWMMAAVQAGLLSGFLLAWGDSGLVPFLPGANLYEQLRTIQLVFLAVATPWAVCRVSAEAPREEWPWMALLSCSDPGRLLLARLIALAIYFILVQAASLAPAVLAQQMAGVAASRVAFDFVATVAFLVGAAALTLHVVSWARRRIAPWMASAAAIAAFGMLLASTRSPSAELASSVLGAVAGAWALAYRADRGLQFASGRPR